MSTTINLSDALVNLGIPPNDVQLKPSEGAFVDGDKTKLDDSSTHTTRTDNPHGVTKTQVGLNNVDNTADIDKPVSTAQQTALNDKQDILTEGEFVDGDKTKLDNIEANADVTDTANVTAAGALMDSEVINLAAVKSFDPIDYATAAQGALADTALQPGDLNISSATETTEGVVELATEAEVLSVADVDAVVRAKHMRVKVENDALSVGDLGGNARGDRSITIQTFRSTATQVASSIDSTALGSFTTASGYSSTALGSGATASGHRATALGFAATASGNYATALGFDATALGFDATAVGPSSTALGSFTTASGSSSTALGSSSTALGPQSTASSIETIAIGKSASASAPVSLALGESANASGAESIAIGTSSFSSGEKTTALGAYGVASGNFSTAIGDNASASGNSSTALGRNTTATQLATTAVGMFARASAANSTAIGTLCHASRSESGAFGFRVLAAAEKVQELGVWGAGDIRSGAVRVHGTGMVALTIQDRATAYLDGGTSVGLEADNTVIREGFAIRRNGDDLLIDVNIGGVVKTLNLGTAV